MGEIRALIVDDEPLARRGIRQLLAPYADVVVIGECRNGREALHSLATVAADLVFLDIQMPGMDGLEVIRAHGVERMPAIVFVTAHDQFAVQAFEAHALDYLVKPLAEARFRTTMARVMERMQTRDAVALAARLRAMLGDTAGPSSLPAEAVRARDGTGPLERITVPNDTGEIVIDASEIDWIEADDYHAHIHAGPKRYRVRLSLSALEARLDPSQFVRVHRMAMARLTRIRELQVDASDREAHVVLRDGTRLPVSRRRIAHVRSLLRSSMRH